MAAAVGAASDPTIADLDVVLDQLGFFVADITDPGESARRFVLRHEAFAEFFRAGPWDGHSAFVDVLLAAVPHQDGARVWTRVSAYTRLNLLTHVRKAGRIDEILASDPLALAATDHFGVMAALPAARQPRAIDVARVARRATYALTEHATFGDAAAALRFHASAGGGTWLTSALSTAAAQMPWQTGWGGGAPPSRAWAVGPAAATRALVPVGPPAEREGGGAEGGPQAVVLHPDGTCEVQDALSRVPLSRSLRVFDPDEEPPECFTAWRGSGGDVRCAAAWPDGRVVVSTLIGPVRGAGELVVLRTGESPSELFVLAGPGGIDLVGVQTQAPPVLSLWPIGASTPRDRLASFSAGSPVVALAATADAGALLYSAGGLFVCRVPAGEAPTVRSLKIAGVRRFVAAGDANRACLVVDDGDQLRAHWLDDALTNLTDGGQLTEGGPTTHVALTAAAGRALVATGDGHGRVQVFALGSHRPPERMMRIETDAAVRQLAFLEGRPRLLAVAHLSGEVRVVDVGTVNPDGDTAELAVTHPWSPSTGPAAEMDEGPSAPALNPGESAASIIPLGRGADGPLLATRAPGGLTKVWQIDQAAPRVSRLAPLPLGGQPISTIAGASVGATAAFALTGSVYDDRAHGWLIDLASGTTVRSLPLPHREPVGRVSVAALAGHVLACAAGESTVSAWEIDAAGTVRDERAWSSDQNLVEHLAVLDGSGTPVVVAAGPEAMRVWCLDGRPVYQSDDPVNCLTWHRRPDGGRTVVAGTDDGLVRVLSVTDGPNVVTSERILEHGGPVSDVTVLARPDEDESIVSIGRDGDLRVWNQGEEDEPWAVLETGRWGLTCSAGAPALVGPPWLVAVSQDGPLLWWDVARRGQPRLVHHVASPGGRLRHLVAGDGVLAGAYTSGAVIFVRFDGDGVVTAQLNSNLTALVPLSGTGWFLAAYDRTITAIRPNPVPSATI